MNKKYKVPRIYTSVIIQHLAEMKDNKVIEDFDHRNVKFIVVFSVNASSDGHKELSTWLNKNKIVR